MVYSRTLVLFVFLLQVCCLEGGYAADVAFSENGAVEEFFKHGDLRSFFVSDADLFKLEKREHALVSFSSYVFGVKRIYNEDGKVIGSDELNGEVYELRGGGSFKQFLISAIKLENSKKKYILPSLDSLHVTIIKKHQIYSGYYFSIKGDIKKIKVASGDLVVIRNGMP